MRRRFFLFVPLGLVSCQENQSPKPGAMPPKKPATPEPEKPVSKKPPEAGGDAAFVGQPLKEAEKLAEKQGLRHRVTMLDGEPQPATRDYRPDRVNFEVKGGKVVGVSRG